jgi:DNA repair protein RecN (Recombination protein N)
MLKKLIIQNYALIDEIEISLDRGLNILTGETGAGKSIILGALGLVMGERADMKALFDPDQNCLVEATLDISNYKLQRVLEENDLEYEPELVIRRVISKNGKSRAFVNDLPVGLKTLETLTAHLIQLHNQYDNLDLANPGYQLKMLDALAGNHSLLIEYREKWARWQSEKKELNQLLDEKASFDQEKDFIRFQYEELIQIDLEAARDEDIENSLDLLSNAEAIQQAMQAAHFSLTEDENGVVEKLSELVKQLEQAGEGTQLVDNLTGQLQQQIEQLNMLSNEFYEQAEKIEYDPERIEQLQQLQNQLNKLMLKHRVDSIDVLIGLRESFAARLNKEMEVGELIAGKEKNIAKLHGELVERAGQLSKKRQEIAKSFGKKIVDQLKELGMPHAQIEGRFSSLNTPESTGMDGFELLFNANKGGKPESIRNVASGGELSRLSLCIKSILAGHMALPTLIFDEIEAGISGEIAMKMGLILKSLSNNHQVINITHSAQIASRGHRHFFVYKSHEKDRSVSRIKTLNAEEKITEIAKMLSGDPPTPTAIKNAEELIHLN